MVKEQFFKSSLIYKIVKFTVHIQMFQVLIKKLFWVTFDSKIIEENNCNKPLAYPATYTNDIIWNIFLQIR